MAEFCLTTHNAKELSGIFELDNATNDRLLAEEGRSAGIDARELVFGIPSYRIINAAFCHPSNRGGRFNSSSRGAWYCGILLQTAQVEVAYHKQLWLRETQWDEDEKADYVDYLADFRTEMHDLRSSNGYEDCLSPTSYDVSQTVAVEFLSAGSAGVIYSSLPPGRNLYLLFSSCFGNARSPRPYLFKLSLVFAVGHQPKFQAAPFCARFLAAGDLYSILRPASILEPASKP